MRKITIAIDGYSSCGKSTLAKSLAQKLNYSYIDTGAMYRAVTLYAIQHGIISEKGLLSEKELIKALPNISINFVFNPKNRHSETYLNKVNVEKEIRSMEVSKHVSQISAIKEVRQKMVSLQRKMGKNKAVVLDGRDIGTNVFPDAELKIFMTADPKIRAARRMDEMSSKGEFHKFEEVLENLLKRDREDMNRKENPLVQAQDAIVLDNSELNREEQLEFVLKLFHELDKEKEGNE